jgi:hypothetical protein
MIFLDPQAAVNKQVTSWVSQFAHVFWQTMATLVPAGIIALAKILQNQGRSRRASQLTDRISQLSKSIAELPDVPVANAAGVTPRSALTAELNLAVTELSTLQTKVRYNLREATTTFAARLRGVLLLYRPKGKYAVWVHTLFYLYGAFFVFCVLSVLTYGGDNSKPFFNTANTSDLLSSVFAFIFIVGIFSIPLFFLHHVAARFHRAQFPLVSSPAPEPRTSEAHTAPAIPL